MVSREGVRHFARFGAAAMLALAAVALPLLARAGIGSTVLPPRGEDGPVTVFYPAAEAEQVRQVGLHRLQFAWDGTPVRGNGRLVVISHGSGGGSTPHSDLAKQLATAGFVVALPEHRGDNWRDMRDVGPASWKRRPAEVSRAIDTIAATPRLAALLSLDRVGVHGMSAGGHTALTLAGGRWSPHVLRRHCETHLDTDFHACVGTLLELRGGALDGLKKAVVRAALPFAMGDTRWYAHQDPRIAAIVAQVPLAADFDLDSLKQPRVPLGIVQAGRDAWLAPHLHSGAVLRACTGCTLVADLPGAGHASFLSPQPVVDGTAGRLLADPPGFDRALVPQVHARIVAFFRQHLE